MTCENDSRIQNLAKEWQKSFRLMSRRGFLTAFTIAERAIVLGAFRKVLKMNILLF